MVDVGKRVDCYYYDTVSAGSMKKSNCSTWRRRVYKYYRIRNSDGKIIDSFLLLANARKFYKPLKRYR